MTVRPDQAAARSQRARAIGLFRYQLIREAADPGLSTRGQGSVTTTENRRPATTSSGRSASELAAPEERGSLEVSPNVVRKVAQRVADRNLGTLRTPRRIGGEHGSSARVDGTDSTVDIVLDVALRYPAPVRETTEQVRRQVTDEVERITGYRVRAVTFTVSALLGQIASR